MHFCNNQYQYFLSSFAVTACTFTTASKATSIVRLRSIITIIFILRLRLTIIFQAISTPTIIFPSISILSFIFRTKSILKIIFRSISIATVTVWLKPILTTFFRSKSRSVKTAWSTFSFTFINSDLLNSYPIRRRHCPNRVLSIYFWVYYCVYLSKIVWLWSKVLNRDRKFSSDHNLLSVSFDRIMSRCNVIVLLNRDEMCPVRKELFQDDIKNINGQLSSIFFWWLA